MKLLLLRVALLVISLLAGHVYGMEEIRYKGVEFGIGETQFLERFSSEDFTCKKRFSVVGRQCSSFAATYADFPVIETSAFFVRNQLIGVWIDVSFDKKENGYKQLSDYGLMVSALVNKYGSNRKVERIASNGFDESQTWEDGRGKSIMLQRTSSSMFGTSVVIYIGWDKGSAIFDAETKEEARRRAYKQNGDM